MVPQSTAIEVSLFKIDNVIYRRRAAVPARERSNVVQ